MEGHGRCNIDYDRDIIEPSSILIKTVKQSPYQNTFEVNLYSLLKSHENENKF
jgi:hypothetical protein